MEQEDKEHELKQGIMRLWERYKSLCIERLGVIEEADIAISSGSFE